MVKCKWICRECGGSSGRCIIISHNNDNGIVGEDMIIYNAPRCPWGWIPKWERVE